MNSNSIIIDKDGKRRRGGRGEILKDGETLVVGLAFMDGVQRSVAQFADGRSGVTDAYGDAAGHAPGYAFAPSAAARQLRDEAYAEGSLQDRWRDPSPSAKAAATRTAVTRAPTTDSREKAYAEGSLQDRWRGAA